MAIIYVRGDMNNNLMCGLTLNFMSSCNQLLPAKPYIHIHMFYTGF